MTYLIFGENSFAVKQKIRDIIAGHENGAQKPDIIHISEDTFSDEDINIFIHGGNLFDKKSIIVLQNLFQKQKAKEIITPILSRLQKSDNVIIFEETSIEDKLLNTIASYINEIRCYDSYSPKELRSWVKKHAAEKKLALSIDELELLIERAKKDPWAIDRILEIEALGGTSITTGKKNNSPINLFHISDLVLQKKPAGAYVLYHNALENGAAPEEIFWKLYWQFKTLLLVSRYENTDARDIANKSGLHPFVVKKCKQALTFFQTPDIEKIVEWMILLWQEQKIKARELPLELEFFVLTLKPLVHLELP